MSDYCNSEFPKYYGIRENCGGFFLSEKGGFEPGTATARKFSSYEEAISQRSA